MRRLDLLIGAACRRRKGRSPWSTREPGRPAGAGDDQRMGRTGLLPQPSPLPGTSTHPPPFDNGCERSRGAARRSGGRRVAARATWPSPVWQTWQSALSASARRLRG